LETTVTPEQSDRATFHRFLPFAWLALSAVWAAVIFITDQLAWPLALWIATTVGPLTALETRHRHQIAHGRDGARGLSRLPQDQGCDGDGGASSISKNKSSG
jgi:hypothetical protein